MMVVKTSPGKMNITSIIQKHIGDHTQCSYRVSPEAMVTKGQTSVSRQYSSYRNFLLLRHPPLFTCTLIDTSHYPESLIPLPLFYAFVNMANFFTLPLELRQQILFEAFTITDKQDAQSLPTFSKLLKCGEESITSRIHHFAQVAVSDDPASEDYCRVFALRYCPKVAQLILCLCAADDRAMANLAYVVNKWQANSLSISRTLQTLTMPKGGQQERNSRPGAFQRYSQLQRSRRHFC